MVAITGPWQSGALETVFEYLAAPPHATVTASVSRHRRFFECGRRDWSCAIGRSSMSGAAQPSAMSNRAS
jgi:hypothetical protein